MMEKTEVKKCYNSIRTYSIRLDGDCSKEQSLVLYEMLPKERKELVDQARNEEIAKKRLYTGAFLQYVLSKETGIPVEKLQYIYNEWGKPELDVKNIVDNVQLDAVKKERIESLSFNLSHSGNYAVLAVSDSPIGVDIECKNRNYMSLAKRCFCKEEYEDIEAVIGEEERKRRFLEYWTMKEAYIKYVGEGLRIPLNSFRIERGQEGNSFLVEDETIIFRTFFVEEEYCVSLCNAQRTNVQDESCVWNFLSIQDVDFLLSDIGKGYKNIQETY